MEQIDFLNLTDKSFDDYEVVYNSLLVKTLRVLGIQKENVFIGVTFVSNAKIQEINNEYRHIDRVTDVISFAFQDAKEKLVGDDVPYDLGEIYISTDKAIEQAKEYKNSLQREMSFLFVHGLLHLLGYDHMKKEDEEVMFKLQDKILEKE